MHNTGDILLKIHDYGMPGNEPDKEIFECYVSGMSYYDANTIWDRIDVGTEMTLERKHDNPKDSNAIEIVYHDESDDRVYKIGYIPMRKNEHLALIMDMGWSDILGCRISEKTDENYSQRMIKISVYVRNINGLKKTSFSEYRAAYIDNDDLKHIKDSLYRDGYVYFRWGGFPCYEHNLPDVKEKVFLIYRGESKAEIYMMSVIAKGDSCIPFFSDPDDIDMIDDCIPFILTNIKSTDHVDVNLLDFLDDEDIHDGQPETYIAKSIFDRLKQLM